MKWDVSYRDGEVEARVGAETIGEAEEKFLRGDVESVVVNYGFFHPDMVEAELSEGGS